MAVCVLYSISSVQLTITEVLKTCKCNESENTTVEKGNLEQTAGKDFRDLCQ